MNAFQREIHAAIRHATSTRVEGFLPRVISIGLRKLGAAEGSILVFSGESSSLTFRMTVTRSGKKVSKLEGLEVPANRSVVGAAFLSGNIQMGPTQFTGIAEKTGVHNCVLAVPWLVCGTRVGVLSAVRTDGGQVFAESAVACYAEVARICADACEARLRVLRAIEVAKSILASRQTSGSVASMPAADPLSMLLIEKFGKIADSPTVAHSPFDTMLQRSVLPQLGWGNQQTLAEFLEAADGLLRSQAESTDGEASLAALSNLLRGLGR